jgi:hypothetical protein
MNALLLHFFCLAISEVVSLRDSLVGAGGMMVHVAKNKKRIPLDSCHRRFRPGENESALYNLLSFNPYPLVYAQGMGDWHYIQSFSLQMLVV